jgi:hypothetical protein
MTKRRVQLFTAGLLLSSILIAVLFARFATAQEIVRPENFIATPALEELANYRQWVRVNEKPLQVLATSSAGG